MPIAAFLLVQLELAAAESALSKLFLSDFVECQQRSVRFRGG